MKKRILSIDDEELIRIVMKLHLGSSGYDITTVNSGKEGLELADSESFDLILCDIKLPGESGIDVIKTLKDLQPDRPVIAVTGFIGDAIVSMVGEAGASDYIAKPFTKKDLLTMVEKQIGSCA